MTYKIMPLDEWRELKDKYDTVRGERVYLAGPMTGLPLFNYPAFNSAAARLRRLGIPVHNPAEQHGGRTDLPRETYLKEALGSVLKCAAVVVLPGWQDSKGTKAELFTAEQAGIPVYGWYAFRHWLEASDSDPETFDWRGELAAREAIRRETTESNVQLAPRADALREAADLITGDRNNQYGPPTADFTRTAAMLTALGFRANGEDIKSHQVALIIAAVKMSRLMWSPRKRDSWVDLAGYAACGYECATTEEEETENGSRAA